MNSLFLIIKEGGIVKKVRSFAPRLSFKCGGTASLTPAHIKKLVFSIFLAIILYDSVIFKSIRRSDTRIRLELKNLL